MALGPTAPTFTLMDATPPHETLRGRLARRALAAVFGTSLVALAVAACGSSGSTSSSVTSRSTSTTSSAQATATSAQSAGASSVTTGPVQGTLRGQNHAPKVNRTWSYSVTVTDAAGHPLSGTVAIQFVFNGQVVGRDTPPTHPITNGGWRDRVTFPAPAIGMPLSFRAVVHTSRGSITLDWPIKVQP